MSKYNMAEYKRSGTDCYQIAGKEETTQMFKIAICDDENLFTEELKKTDLRLYDGKRSCF